MKKIGLGIAIILFGILLEVSIEGHLAYFSWAIGAIGLIVAIAGCIEKDQNKNDE